MNKFKISHVVLGITFLLSTTMCSEVQKNENQEQGTSTGNGKNTLAVIHERSSIRNYTDREVSAEILETIVKAGMAAPSAMNKQPWQFIVITDKKILEGFGERIPTSRMAQKAMAAIVVCGDMEKAGEGWLQEYWIQDCSAASQNILLAITDLGLGGVWTGIYPDKDRIQVVAEILSLPEHIIPLNIIPLGYPALENNPVKDKWIPENVHWNKW